MKREKQHNLSQFNTSKPGPKGPRKSGVTIAPPEPRETWDVTVRVTLPPRIYDQPMLERNVGELINDSMLPCRVIGIRAEFIATVKYTAPPKPAAPPKAVQPAGQQFPPRRRRK